MLAHVIGAGESGKSTTLRQMKLIHSGGFSEQERLLWRPVVFRNIVESFRTIYEAMSKLNYQFDHPDNEVGFTQRTTRRTFQPPWQPCESLCILPNCDTQPRGGGNRYMET